MLHVRLDRGDRIAIPGVVCGYLNDAAAGGKDEMMRGAGLAETHARMIFAALHDSGVVLGIGLCKSRTGSENRGEHDQSRLHAGDYSPHLVAPVPDV